MSRSARSRRGELGGSVVEQAEEWAELSEGVELLGGGPEERGREHVPRCSCRGGAGCFADAGDGAGGDAVGLHVCLGCASIRWWRVVEYVVEWYLAVDVKRQIDEFDSERDFGL